MARFDLSFGSAVMKIYPFAILHWVKNNENMYPNNFTQPIGQIPLSFENEIYCLILTVSQAQLLFLLLTLNMFDMLF